MLSLRPLPIEKGEKKGKHKLTPLKVYSFCICLCLELLKKKRFFVRIL